MSRILYFDCFSGISGDMALGALLDAGLPLAELKKALGSLAVEEYEVSATRVLRTGIAATKFTLHEVATGHEAQHTAPGTQHEAPDTQHPHGHDHSHGDHHHDHDHEDEAPGTAPSTQHLAQHLAPGTQHEAQGTQHHHSHHTLVEISNLIERSSLSQAGRDRAKLMFLRLAEAEASIHQMPVEQVHLHEVGALDSIIDVVGIVFAMEWVGADRIVCSPLNVGGGMVHSAHGLFPVPAPATVKLLGTAPVYGGTVQKELVTPTGALIVSTYADAFGPVPAMTIERVGYGAGEREDAGTPNVLRVLIGEASDRPQTERATVIECEIDDMNPQIFGVVMDRLYAAGALEVFYVPVQMKKNRPGTLLTVIVAPEKRGVVTDVIFQETTTIGLRAHDVDRECLDRESIVVDTPLGVVRFKVAGRDGRVLNAAPEFDDCVRLAAANNLSVKEVQALAVQAYRARDVRR